VVKDRPSWQLIGPGKSSEQRHSHKAWSKVLSYFYIGKKIIKKEIKPLGRKKDEVHINKEPSILSENNITTLPTQPSYQRRGRNKSTYEEIEL
jgi:hypothetical protein